MHALPHLIAAGHLPSLGHVLAGGDRLYDRLRRRLFHDSEYIPVGVVLEALAAAACYAAASVLQQQAASAQPQELSMRPGLIGALLRQPRFWLGTLGDAGGYLFLFLALRHGSLALVEPLMVAGLVFALPASAIMAHRRLTRGEWGATLAVVSGLVLFLVVAAPGPGDPRATNGGWLALGVITLLCVLAAVTLGRGSVRRRALWLGAGTGIVLGVTSAVTERAGHLLDHGLLSLLSSWTPYALVAGSVLGLVLNQSAFQAGDLKLSLPLLTVAQPLVGILIGQLLFGEHMALGGLAPVGEAVGLVLMALGVFGLARGPLGGGPPGSGAPRVGGSGALEGDASASGGHDSGSSPGRLVAG